MLCPSALSYVLWCFEEKATYIAQAVCLVTGPWKHSKGICYLSKIKSHLWCLLCTHLEYCKTLQLVMFPKSFPLKLRQLHKNGDAASMKTYISTKKVSPITPCLSGNFTSLGDFPRKTTELMPRRLTEPQRWVTVRLGSCQKATGQTARRSAARPIGMRAETNE